MRKIYLFLCILLTANTAGSAQTQATETQVAETHTPLVKEGQTWWYKSTALNTKIEYGLRIGSQVQLDGKIWNKIYVCLHYKDVYYDSYVDPTFTWMELPEDEGLVAYIREEYGKIYVSDDITRKPSEGKYAGQGLYGLPKISQFWRGFYTYPKAEILTYDFESETGAITLGIITNDSPGHKFVLKEKSTINNHARNYTSYTYTSDNDMFMIPDECTFVQGIGIMNFEHANGVFYNPFPMTVTGFNPEPELRYVTDGADNEVIFEALGGTKLWEEYAGVTDCIFEPEGDRPIYYNLQGVKVEKPEKGQVYIKKQGATVSKTLFR